MGMPTTAVYILLATLIAPSIVETGVTKMAAHMFVLYFGMLSMITPPVALAAYAAANISKAGVMETGWAACRIGWVKFVLPFMFVLVADAADDRHADRDRLRLGHGVHRRVLRDRRDRRLFPARDRPGLADRHDRRRRCGDPAGFAIGMIMPGLISAAGVLVGGAVLVRISQPPPGDARAAE